MRACPRLRRGAPPQISQAPPILQGPQASQAMITAAVATPPAQPVRGGGRTGRGRARGGGQSRYYVLPARTEAVTSDSVITGIIPVYHRDTSVLFDLGSTYSYVSSYFSPYCGVSRDFLSSYVYVSTSVGEAIIVGCVYLSCLIVISGFKTRADLLLLSMVDFDIILGMDWLSPYHAILDCYAKTVALSMPSLLRLEWRAYVRDVSVDTPTVESVPVVRDFSDVFSVDLSGIPPDRDIDFGIDLLPGTQPISIPPYHMAPTELKELKE
ncbi:uncharacterized protein [Nicotiana tomentosiformis]|uniref:uncharacterized protein n=1 Tax=Nicotiana tomentosiformis TaxID=4098 RepID=UPI00388CE1E9